LENNFLLCKPPKIVYNNPMDDRKNQISDAEQRKRDQTALLDALLARLGEAIFERTGDSTLEDVSAFVELAAYRRFKTDISSSQDSIQSAEEQMRRFKELEETITGKEREETLFSREVSSQYGRLGKLLLEEARRSSGDSRAYEDFCSPYRVQAEELLNKVESLEERLAGLENREKGNVFTWIGKSAQGLVLRSFLGKAQENLEQLRRTVGERFSRRGSKSLFPEAAAIDTLCEEIEQRRAELQFTSRELANFREEKRRITESFSADGGPVRHIQAIKNHIVQVQNELKILYRRVGNEASAGDASGAEADPRRRIILSYVRPEDGGSLESAERMRQTIRDCDTVIEKLRASLAIDDEKARIGKSRRMIQENKEKIAQSERSILELEGAIKDSEASIEKLQRLL